MSNFYGDFTIGSIVYIPFNTFDSNDPTASVTITDLINTDIHIHKNDGTTQRNNAAGIVMNVNFDGITGNHMVEIDTSDNTVANFWVGGADYFVRMEGTTVDAGTINAWVGSFSIENRRIAGELISTTIATLASQISFTLTTGSADDDAYNNCTAIISDQVSGIQKAIGRVSDYTGSSLTVALAADPGIFTMAVGDNINIIATSALANVISVNSTAQTANDNGADINTLITQVGTAGDGLTAINLPNQTMDITGNLSGSVGSVTGAVGSVTGAVGSVTAQVTADMTAISGDTTAADNLEATYDGTGYTDDFAPAQQQQVVSLTASGSTIATAATSGSTVTTGTVASGTYASTGALDGTYWQIQDDAGTIDMYLEFNVTNVGVPTSASFTGRLNGNNDTLNVYGYDWVAAGWVQIGTLAGKTPSTDDPYNYILFDDMVGTGANAALVRFRFQNTGLTSANFYIDSAAGFYLPAGSATGYAMGAIWINTLAGVSGTVDNVNGTADNPVDSIADANTLAASLNINRFYVTSGSTITFAASQENQQFDGCNWTLALGGQSISNTVINCAEVTGIATGASAPQFLDCHFGNVTLPPCHIDSTGLEGTFTMGSAGDFFFDTCHSGVAGTSAPILDFGGALNASNVNMRRYSGGIEVQNMGAGTGSYNMSLEGHGQLIINANCSATSTIAYRGHFPLTDNAGGAVTLSNTGAFDHNTIIDDILVDTATTIPATLAALNDISTAQVNTEVDTALSDIHLDHLLAVDYDPAAKPGTATALLNELVESDAGVSRYTTNALEQAPGGAGANPNMLLDAEIAVVNTQVEFTLATGSDQDDAYNSQAIVLYDDTNSDFPSIRTVDDYVGSTKTVTISSAPDFTLGADDSVRIFVTAPGTVAPTAVQIVDEWEVQSQADPTGFHVNVKEVNGTAQTANDNSLDINTLITQVGTAGDGLTAINLPNQTMDITGSLSGSVGSVTGAVGSVTGSVGSVTGAVGSVTGAVGSLTGHTVQTGDNYAIVNHVSYGNAQLVRSTTPANTLDVAATGEAGLDFDNVKAASAPTTLTNITVPVVTTNTDMVGTDNAALAATALSTATYTAARAGYMDELAAANLPADVDAILVDTATTIPASIAALNDISVANILAGVVEGTITVKQSLSLALSVLTGKSSGGGTNTITFRDTADTKDRVVATVDANQDRTAITTRDGS